MQEIRSDYRQQRQQRKATPLQRYFPKQRTNTRIATVLNHLKTKHQDILLRHTHIITKNDYYCIPCFSNCDEYPSEYLIHRSLKLSPTHSEWDLMDEAVLMTAFRTWGYSNWGQIKQYMDYNQSAFSLQEIIEHYKIFHYDQPNNLLQFPEQIPAAKPHTPYGQLALRNYEQILTSQPSGINLKHKDSKCEKKPTNRNQLNNPDNEGGLKPSSASIIELANAQAENKIKKIEQNQCSVLGYNPKRAEFQGWYYDPDAQKMLDELEFYDNDSPQEFQIKIALIKEYNRRLDQRAKRKDFTLEYKLLDSHYQFSLKPEEQKASLIFQPFMRFTQNYQQYHKMIETFTTLLKEQSFITNLQKIRRIAKEGTIDFAYSFLNKKRTQSIRAWQQNYNKTYPNSRKRKVYKKVNKQDGTIVLQNENVPDEPCPISYPAIEAAIEAHNAHQTTQLLKVVTLSNIPDNNQMEVE